jgi:hypothetical protein
MPDPSSPFNIKYQPAALAQIRHWADQSHVLRINTEMSAALAMLVSRLRADPCDFGDPYQDLKLINATKYRGMVVNWFLVWYGVDRDARQVVVYDLATAPGSKLF